MTKRSGAIGASSLAIALGLIMFALPAAAQDLFSLPPGTASPAARPPGPVDSDSPVVRARPSPMATPRPAAETPTPTATTSRTPGPPRPSPRASTTTQPAVAPAVTPAVVSPGTPTSSATVTALPSAAPAPTATAPAAAQAPASDWAAFATGALIGALALLALVGGLIWRRRKSGTAPTVAFEPPEVTKPRPAPAPTPAPVPSTQPTGIEIALEARRLDASLVATTLAYQLRVTNTGGTALNALTIEGDMVAAHSSLPVEQQIANPGQPLEPRHAVPTLAPGESAEFKGELRVPLTAITPIRAGNAAYFVPLARLRLTAEGPVVVAQTFVIGDLPEQPGGALRPFRLDLGPRTFSKLGQRAVG